MSTRNSYEKAFDEDVSLTDDDGQCPECGGRVTMNVHETVCDECGLVIEDEKVDHGPEWTCAGEEESDRRRVGGPNTVARHDRGIGSTIGWNRDANGRLISGRRRSQLGRLRREHRRAKFESKAERNRMQAFLEIRRMASALGLEKSVRERACQLFRSGQDAGLLRGRSIEAIAAGCVYAVCRILDHPRTFGDIEAVAVVSRSRIENGYSVLNRELGLPVPPASPMQYLPKIASAVDVSAMVERRARAILRDAEREVSEGVHPAGVAAGAVYVAGRERGEAVTQSALAAAADVSKATVRARYRELK